MAWPAEAGSLGLVRAPRKKRKRKRVRSRVFTFAGLRGKYYMDARGKYRIFNAAEYRFYRSNSAPPKEGDAPFATSATLPHEPADVYANGTWYLSVSYFNGVIDSGFLPLGPEGQTYLQLVIEAGAEINNPPNPPMGYHLEVRAGGVIRCHAFYIQSGSLAADEWAIAYKASDIIPPEDPLPDDPDITVVMKGQRLEVLSYDLPAQDHGKHLAVYFQTRRNDGTVGVPNWQYSSAAAGYVKYADADAEGPAEPEHMESWPGNLPEDL